MTIRLSLMYSAATVCLAIVLPAAPAAAQNTGRVDALEKRMDAVESKLDAVLNLLTQQSGSKADRVEVSPNVEEDADNNSIAETAEGIDVSEMKPGMALDLYIVSNQKDLAATAEGTPVASAIIEAPQAFEYAAFGDVPTMQRYGTPQAGRLGLLWTGYVNFPDSGSYTFQTEAIKDDDSKTEGCVASLRVDGKMVSRANLSLDRIGTNNYNFRYEAESAVGQGQIALQKGLHEIGLWGACGSTEWPIFERVHFTFSYKGPRDRAPKLFDPAKFLINP